MKFTTLHLQQQILDIIKMFACITILAVIVTGCATDTYKPFKLSEFEIQELGFSYADFIHVGDQVNVHTNDAKQYEFEVTSIDYKSIKGKDIQVSLTDISSVDRKLNARKGMSEPDASYVVIEILMEILFDSILFHRL